MQGDAFGFMKLCAFIITELKNLSAASRANAGSASASAAASSASAAAAGKIFAPFLHASKSKDY